MKIKIKKAMKMKMIMINENENDNDNDKRVVQILRLLGQLLFFYEDILNVENTNKSI